MPTRIFLALCASLFTAELFAATFTVDSDLDLVDDLPGDGVCLASAALPGPACTLRAAIMEAEANGEADTVVITEGLQIELTLAGDGGSEVGVLDISTEIEILGFVGAMPANPALLPLIDASGIADRHFFILGGDVTLRGLRLVGGATANSGGAVWAAASSLLRVESSWFANNAADIRGGAIRISSSTTATIEDSHFFRNDGGTAGGAALSLQGGSVTVRRSSFLDNRSAATGSTITLFSDSTLQIENSTLDGTPFRPPIAGIAARRGIWQADQSTLILRNTTISNFSDNAIDLNGLDGDEFVRISNSILQSDGTACVASGADLEAADVEIGFSMIQHEENCADFYRFGVRNGIAELEPLTDDEPPRLTVSRRPIGPLSNVVDTGPEIDFIPGGNQFACAFEDQLGRPRPIDANLDENPRCDLGAIEQVPPEPLIVNFNIVDRVDDIPGDGECATVDFGIGPVCTLRAAIMEANALPGLQHIIFQPFNDPVVLTLPDSGGVGGALEITDTVAIDGNLEDGRPATSIEGQMVGERLFTINAPNFNVYLRNLRLTGGMDDGGFGGAIFSGGASDLTIARSELFANRSDDGSGGAIAVGSGSLTVRDSDFENNVAEFDGQAIYGNGGTDIEIANSSFRNHLGAPGSPVHPAVSLNGNDELTITNSTFSGNLQGIRAVNPARFILFHGTFFENSDGALDIELDASSEFTLVNSIFAAPVSTADDCVLTQVGVPAGFQVFGVLDSDGSCVSVLGTGLTGDPGLLSLTRPPGRISYHHPLQVDAANPSPAIDVGELFACQLATDQLGNPRPVDFVEVPDVDGPCDLGSVEAQVFDLLFNDSFEF